MRAQLVPAAIVLAATASTATADDAPSLPAAIGVSVSATSTLVAKSKTYEAWYALGVDPTRFWCEGKSDEGIGEALVLKLSAPTKLDSLVIRAGVWRSPELFRANNRITELDIVTDDGRVKKVALREEREDLEVSLGRAPVSELRFEIAKVAKGRMNDTCISGIDLHPAGGGAIVLGADATAASALEPTFAKAWHAFDTCDEVGLRAVVKLPFVRGEVGTRGKRYADAKAVRKGCKAGEFSTFVLHPDTPHVKSEAPGKLMLENDTLEWHFVLDGHAWKLASLVDQTP